MREPGKPLAKHDVIGYRYHQFIEIRLPGHDATGRPEKITWRAVAPFRLRTHK